MKSIPSLDIATLRGLYQAGDLTPQGLVDALLARLGAKDSHNIWISRLDADALRNYARNLDARDIASLPLYGIPFAIKDNIDLVGLQTTAGCPEFAYTPNQHATVVQRLIDAGAIPIGKTNLDQFATGLNGTRSPYGACRNAFNPDFISGGSSSGSAVSVALGLASFSLGTDTAGSGRVPAAFNNLVGHKPSCGTLSTRGVVPACRSLDAVSIFALTAEDAERVLAVAAGFDAADEYSRALAPHGFDFGRAGSFRFGVPMAKDLEFFGNAEAKRLFGDAVARMLALGGTAVEIDLAPFLETARLLYGGPWVAERYLAIRDFFDAQSDKVFPPVREIIAGGRTVSAADTFDHIYKLRAAKRLCDAAWKDVDVMLTGDVVVSDGYPSLGDANSQQWLAALDKIRALKPRIIVPGHGELATHETLDTMSGYIRALSETVGEYYATGMSRKDVVSKVRSLDDYPLESEDRARGEQRLKASLQRVYDEFKERDKELEKSRDE